MNIYVQLLVLLVLSTGCSSKVFLETEQLVGRHKEKIIDRCYGKGRLVKTQIIGFAYHRFTGTWTIDLRLSWKDASDLYWAEGVLAVYAGGAARWSGRRHSNNLENRLQIRGTRFESVSLLP